MKIDELYWDLRARTEGLKRDFSTAQRDARAFTRSIEGPGGPVKAVESIGGAGKKIATDLRRSGTEVEGASKLLASRILRTLNREFRARQGELRGLLLDGSISVEEFDQLAAEAAQRFNDGLTAALTNLGDTFPPEERRKLVESFKALGEESGEGLGSGAASGMAAGVSRASGLMRAGLIGAFVVAGVAVVQQAAKLGRAIAEKISEGIKRGSDVQALRDTLRNVASARDIDAVSFFRDLRAEYRLLIADSDLLGEATNALKADIPATAAEFGRLAIAARRSAAAVGGDQATAFSDLTRAIEDGNEEAIRAIGLNVDFEKAYDDLALSQGTVVKNLTDHEKLQSRMNETLAVAKQRTAELGEEQLTSGERLVQLETFIANVKDRTLELVSSSDLVTKFFNALGGGAENAADNVDELAVRLGAATLALGEFVVRGGKAALSGNFAGLIRAVAAVPGDVEAARKELERMAQIEERISLFQSQTDPSALLAFDQSLVNLRPHLDDLEEIADLDRQRTAIKKRLVELVNEEASATRQLRAESALDATIDASLAKVRELDAKIGPISGPNLFSSIEQELVSVLASTSELINETFPEIRESVKEQIRLGGDEGPVRQLKALVSAMLDAEAPFEAFAHVLSDNVELLDELEDEYPTLVREMRAYLNILPRATRGTDGVSRSQRSVQLESQRAARAVLDLAQAFGVLDRDGAAVFGSLINVASGIQAIEDAKASASAAGRDLSFSDVLPGATGIVGGIANIVSIASGLFGESPEEARRRELLAKNNDALNRLRKSLERQERLVSGLTGDEISQFRQFSGVDIGQSDTLLDFDPIRAALAAMDDLGISLDDLERFAEQANVDISTFIAVINGTSTATLQAAEELRQLQQAGLDLNFSTLFDDFDEQTSLFEQRLVVFADSFDEPIERLEKMREIILDFGDLPEDLQAQIAGLDFSTPEGRDAAERFFQDLFERSIVDPSVLGDLTPDQFRQAAIDFIEGIRAAREEAGEAGEGSTIPFEVRRAITEVSANRIVAQQDTMIIQDDIRNQLLAQLVAMGGGVPTSLLQVPSAPSASLAPGGTIVTVQNGAVQIHMTGGGDATDLEQQVERGLTAVARRAFAEQVEPDISEIQGDRLTRDQQSLGGSVL